MSNVKNFIIHRYNKTRSDPEHYDSFEIPITPGMTVLTALFYIQGKLDDSLAFRYSCRGLVCGSCAMLINKIPRLACQTQIEQLPNLKPPALKGQFGKMLSTIDWNPETSILVEPLPNFQVLKDLVVDLKPFWEKLEAIQPYIIGNPDPKQRISPDEAKKLKKAANCFLCAACYGSCPINNSYPTYLGPAALAQAWRFVEDPFDSKSLDRLKAVDKKPEGALGCEYYYNCVKVCPRHVAPAREIRLLREKMGHSK